VEKITLFSIASDVRLLNVAHAQHLPPHCERSMERKAREAEGETESEMKMTFIAIAAADLAELAE
jgi:hypothetical protein